MENKIHVSQLKRINEVLEKIKTWKEFNFSDFTYQPELDMPEIPAFKVYLKADHESYFWFRYAVPHIDIKFSPTDNPLKTFEEIKTPHKQQEGFDSWKIALGALDGWKNQMLEIKAEQKRHERLKSEMGVDFDSFINAEYWNSDNPIPTEEKQKFIHSIRGIIDHIDSLSDEEAPSVAKNYFKAELEMIIEFIESNESRKFLKEQFMAFGYAVYWDLMINEHSRQTIIGGFIGFGKLMLVIPV